MESPIALSTRALLYLAQQAQVPLHQAVAVIGLIDEGGTIPFIARYRKEATGNLDEVQIGAIHEKLEYLRDLESRRQTVLASIEEQGKLSPELRARIEGTFDKTELEDLYLPFKPKRRTKASIARERGLEPLAQYLWDQQPSAPLEEFAASFVNPDLGVGNVDAALEGARHIVAEWVGENADFRKHLRQMMLGEGLVVSKAIEGAQDPEGKYKLYADFSEPAAKIPSHRMLAIRRGAKEDILHFAIELDSVKPLTYLKNKVIRAEGEIAGHLEKAIEDSYGRLLDPSIQTEVRLELKDRADAEAIRVFRENLENLLLAPPAGMMSVLALDPGIRTGCKVAAIDETGKFLEHSVIYPLQPKNDIVGSVGTLSALIQKHRARAIAIGNGTGSRETAAFVKDFLRQSGQAHITVVVVNESGASVYSASEIAREEFPELDLTIRGAISIGRRLQDPLAELVKIDPKSIGVGQYQHDVDQRKLKQSLEGAVESCVNRVGVDLNTASFALLRYVAGINERTAHKIVEFRNARGRFGSRAELMEVPGFGPKTFEQAAGFLRIRGGANPLDMTAVHPESYAVVERIARSLDSSVPDLIANPSRVERLKLEDIEGGTAGVYTLRDILEELKKPGRDPREQFVGAQLRDGVNEISDLSEGMVLEGTVTNVTNFGAFVDIGVHQDGLVHVSEISNRYIKDPSEVVKAGQIVKVKVLSADAKVKRIALSIKALLEPAPGRLPKDSKPQDRGPAASPGAKGPKPTERQPIEKKPSLDEQLAQLSNRFRTR